MFQQGKKINLVQNIQYTLLYFRLIFAFVVTSSFEQQRGRKLDNSRYADTSEYSIGKIDR